MLPWLQHFLQHTEHNFVCVLRELPTVYLLLPKGMHAWIHTKEAHTLIDYNQLTINRQCRGALCNSMWDTMQL